MPASCACGCGERVSHSGCYRKGHNPPDVASDPDGKKKRINDANNPRNNGKVQERAREQAEERIAKMQDLLVLVFTF